MDFYEEMLRTVRSYLKSNSEGWWQEKDEQFIKNQKHGYTLERVQNPTTIGGPGGETFQMRYSPRRESLRKVEQQELSKAMAATEEDGFEDDLPVAHATPEEAGDSHPHPHPHPPPSQEP